MTIETPKESSVGIYFDVVVVYFDVVLILNRFHTLFWVSIINFEQLNASWKRYQMF